MAVRCLIAGAVHINNKSFGAADHCTMVAEHGFPGSCPSGDQRVKTAETLPAFLNFDRSSTLLRRGLVIQSRGRKLQHGSSLAGNEARKLHNLAVREFKRIVMRVWIGHIDLTKPR